VVRKDVALSKSKKPKLWDIVQIDWLDSMHTTGWVKWHDNDWSHEANSLKHKTVGYVASMTDEYISVMQSFQDLWEDGHPKVFDALMTIPRKAITKITVLARKNKTPAKD